MKSSKIALVVLFVVVLALTSCSMVGAESRSVIGLKNGAGYGNIGLELEKEFDNQWSVQGGVGSTAGFMSLTGGVRKYAAPEGSRWFTGGFLSVVTDTQLTLPVLGFTGGYEWKVTENIRITVEGGFGYFLILIPAIGISAGVTF